MPRLAHWLAEADLFFGGRSTMLAYGVHSNGQNRKMRLILLLFLHPRVPDWRNLLTFRVGLALIHHPFEVVRLSRTQWGHGLKLGFEVVGG